MNNKKGAYGELGFPQKSTWIDHEYQRKKDKAGLNELQILKALIAKVAQQTVPLK